MLLIGHLFYPKYFKDKINHYRIMGETYYKYLLLLTINDEIVKKYNIDLIDIGMGLYDKYVKLMNKTDDMDKLSELSELSDLGEMDDFVT